MEHKGFPVQLDELNEAVIQWVNEICQKTSGGLNETRLERFAHEKSCLTQLPSRPFDCRQAIQVRVSRESLIRVKNNWYSVPPEHIGEELTVRIDPLSHKAEVFTGEVLGRGITMKQEEQTSVIFSQSLSANYVVNSCLRDFKLRG